MPTRVRKQPFEIGVPRQRRSRDLVDEPDPRLCQYLVVGNNLLDRGNEKCAIVGMEMLADGAYRRHPPTAVMGPERHISQFELSRMLQIASSDLSPPMTEIR